MRQNLLGIVTKNLEVWFEIHTFAERDTFMKKKEQKNFFVKMVEDKKAIIKGIREGVPTKVIEEERDVKFATPV